MLDPSGTPTAIGDPANNAARVNCVVGCGAGGAVTANQGTPNTQANRWPMFLSDGVNPVGTGANPIRTDPTGTTPQPVSGPLTDAQLRAVPVPVSGTVTATGPLTDAQLRAVPVPVSGTVTATGPLTDAQLRATPVPVSGTVAGNQGTPNTTANRWPVQPTDGVNLQSFTGTSANVNCTGGCAAPTQLATYTAEVTSSTSAATKDYLNIFNAAGSGRVIRLVRITVAQGNTAAVVGLSVNLNVYRTSSVGATCTAVTVQNNIDTTNAAVPAQITASHTCTTDPTIVSIVRHCSLSVEETSGGAKKEECYQFDNNGGQPLTLREGQGVMVRNTALAPVGLVSISAEMTF